MNVSPSLAFAIALSCVASARADEPVAGTPIQNPLINYAQFQNIVHRSGEPRELHRMSEQQFLDALRETGTDTVVLDARSAPMYALRHIKGAVNLPFTDFTAETLARVIPDKSTKVMIYCNNNFTGSPISFATKTAAASLNLSTYMSLVAYGYTNIYELGPLLDVNTTRIPFEGTEVALR